VPTGEPGPEATVLRCPRHSVDFLDSSVRPAPALIEKHLDRLYGPAGAEVADPPTEGILEVVASVAKPPGVLHDHGCGNGQLLLEAARRGWTPQGNDVVTQPARTLEALGLRVHVGTLPELDLPSGSADVVTSRCVLPHVSDPRREVAAIHALLRPRGWLVAQLPSDGLYRRVARTLYRLSGRRWSWVLFQVYSPAHRFAFDPVSIRRLLEAEGFDQIDVRAYRQDRRLSLRRFGRRPAAVRLVARTTVTVLDLLGGGRRANHMLVLARRDGEAPARQGPLAMPEPGR
jgi:2-polyprenyl-3-methyl-5-hydroxy-6-metoxy-1,4-benzoquinol methylase